MGFVHRAYWKLKLADAPGGTSLHCIYKECSSTLLPGDVCAGAMGGSWGQVQAMAPHSSSLAWKILWMEEPGRLQSMASRKSRTRLSDFTFTFHFHALEKEMATHSSVLA